MKIYLESLVRRTFLGDVMLTYLVKALNALLYWAALYFFFDNSALVVSILAILSQELLFSFVLTKLRNDRASGRFEMGYISVGIYAFILTGLLFFDMNKSNYVFLYLTACFFPLTSLRYAEYERINVSNAIRLELLSSLIANLALFCLAFGMSRIGPVWIGILFIRQFVIHLVYLLRLFKTDVYFNEKLDLKSILHFFLLMVGKYLVYSWLGSNAEAEVKWVIIFYDGMAAVFGILTRYITNAYLQESSSSFKYLISLLIFTCLLGFVGKMIDIEVLWMTIVNIVLSAHFGYHELYKSTWSGLVMVFIILMIVFFMYNIFALSLLVMGYIGFVIIHLKWR